MTEPQQLQSAIDALEAQRGLLGDAVVDTAVAPLRARLAALAAPTAPPAEPAQALRQVSILFLDVVGSTTLARHLDPETVSAVMDDALARGTAIVEAHHGKVLQYAGDNILAVFGADESREDDTERAVHCGLALLELGKVLGAAVEAAHGHPGFNVRVGVHTGGVLLGGGVDADGSIRGSAVNIAARMEQTAPSGALRISHDTYAQVRGLFDVDAQEPLAVKGVEDAMLTYLVRAARDRSGASVERGLPGLSTPMVGRDAQLQRLQQTVALVRETRQLQALTLMGDAGLGKTRLLREWVATLPDCRVVTVRAQPDGLMRPWGLLRNLLAVQCGVADTDSAEVAQRKVVDHLSPWFETQAAPGDEQHVRQAQLIGQLSGLAFVDSPHLRGLDPRALRDQAFAALRAYLRALATDATLVLMVEDLHWVDDGSLDLLQHLLAHAAQLPMMLAMTSRPALLTRRPDWGAGGDIVTLTPLAAAHSDELVQALLQRVDELPARLTQIIVGEAEGNPYYMEELVRRLLDDGVIVGEGSRWTVRMHRLQALNLPGTLVGLLQARLDALPAGERLAARLASIIGHVFWDDALQALDARAPQALAPLQRAAFVRAHATSDFADTTERQFDHHLLHQVTYDTLLKAERRVGHGAVARWLAERRQGRGAEFLAMIGEHAERAGDTALAIDCFEQAGKEAQMRFANAAATSAVRRALVLLGESDPPRRFDLLSRVRNIADVVGDRPAQEAAIREMSALLERHPDDASEASLRLSLSLLADRRSDAAASATHAREAFELAERCGNAQTAALAQGQLAMLQLAQQAPLRVIAHVETALSWASRIESDHARAHTEAQLMGPLATASIQLCRFDEARVTLLMVLARGEALGLPRVQIGALTNLADAAVRQGRWDEVVDRAERLRTLGQSIGNAWGEANAHAFLGLAAQARDDPAAAIRCHEQALATLHATGDRRLDALLLQRLAVCRLAQGDAAGAMQAQAESQAAYETLNDALGACESAAQGALCAARLGRLNVARATVERLLTRLGGDLAERRAHETMALRWSCQQVLQAAGDARAAPMLAHLNADVHARAAELTGPEDRERLVQALPVFRAIAAAHAQGGEAQALQRDR